MVASFNFFAFKGMKVSILFFLKYKKSNQPRSPVN